MTAITLTFKQNFKHPLDCSGLTPNSLTGKSLAEIAALSLPNGHQVQDYFDVSGDDTQQLIFRNSNILLENIGREMKSGVIIIDGDCGHYLGNSMQGGTIICKGNAGNRVGNKMRRGLLLVEGNVGDYCASMMIAGTVGVLGHTGAHLGYLIRRGTLLLGQSPSPQATWLDCGLHTLPFLNLLYKSFKLFDTEFAGLRQLRVRRWMGDVAVTGKAEMLVLEPS